MKKFLTLTALTVACACAAVPAFADGDSSPVGVSLRVGSFYPSETDTINNVGNGWLSAGFDYKLPGFQVSSLRDGYFSVLIDYASKQDYRSAPLLANYTSGKTLYFSVGAGVNFARFPQDDGDINDKIRFAYSGAIGYNFVNGQIPLFIEVRYFGCEDNRLEGTAFYVGARF